jgi:DNA-binding NtrC family response regulator
MHTSDYECNRANNINSTEPVTESAAKPFFITRNRVMMDLLQKIQIVAKTKATLLITGENGTGKEVLASLFHYYSSRRNRPMVTINCGAIPSDLVESELFGHEKGAFTGAHTQKPGCFELADRGTLFLDEIGEMPLSAQVKLLRAVELESFRRVGGKSEIKVDVSLVSATNKILSDQVKSGSFREDLFYRLNVIELYIPPLRHRKEDIPLLLDFYGNYYSEFYSVSPIEFDKESFEMLIAYDWPGNVRELKNLVERCVVLSDGSPVAPDSLPSAINKSRRQFYFNSDADFAKMIHIPIGTSLEEIEKQVIKQTLDLVDNNKTEAAKLLGFARKTLHNKLDKYKQEQV